MDLRAADEIIRQWRDGKEIGKSKIIHSEVEMFIKSLLKDGIITPEGRIKLSEVWNIFEVNSFDIPEDRDEIYSVALLGMETPGEFQAMSTSERISILRYIEEIGGYFDFASERLTGSEIPDEINKDISEIKARSGLLDWSGLGISIWAHNPPYIQDSYLKLIRRSMNGAYGYMFVMSAVIERIGYGITTTRITRAFYDDRGYRFGTVTEMGEIGP